MIAPVRRGAIQPLKGPMGLLAEFHPEHMGQTFRAPIVKTLLNFGQGGPAQTFRELVSFSSAPNLETSLPSITRRQTIASELTQLGETASLWPRLEALRALAKCGGPKERQWIIDKLSQDDFSSDLEIKAAAICAVGEISGRFGLTTINGKTTDQYFFDILFGVSGRNPCDANKLIIFRAAIEGMVKYNPKLATKVVMHATTALLPGAYANDILEQKLTIVIQVLEEMQKDESTSEIAKKALQDLWLKRQGNFPPPRPLTFYLRATKDFKIIQEIWEILSTTRFKQWEIRPPQEIADAAIMLCFAIGNMEYANDEIGTKQKLAAQTMLSQIIEFTRSKVFKLSQSHIHQAAIFNLGKLNTKEAFEFASGEVLSQISSIPKERFQSATPQEFEAIMRRILWKKGSPGTIGKHQVNIYALVRLAQAMGNFSDPRAVSVLMFLGRWAAMNANNAVPITGLSHLEEKVALAFGQIAEHSLKDSSNAELLLLAKESSEEFELLLGRVLKEDRRCSTYVSLAYLKSLMAFYSAGFYTQDQAKSYLSKMASRMSSTEINQAVSGYLGKIDPINYLLNLRDRPIFTMPFDPSQLVTMEINGNGTARAQLLSDIAGLFTIASDILKNSNDRETRRAAIRAASQPIDMLKKMLRAKDPDVFLTAFLALANLLGKDGLSFLTQSYTLLAIKDSKITGPMADIFPSMLSAIAKLGGDEALQFLTKRIQTVHNVEEKITVARAVSLMFEAKSED